MSMHQTKERLAETCKSHFINKHRLILLAKTQVHVIGVNNEVSVVALSDALWPDIGQFLTPHLHKLVSLTRLCGDTAVK